MDITTVGVYLYTTFDALLIFMFNILSDLSVFLLDSKSWSIAPVLKLYFYTIVFFVYMGGCIVVCYKHCFVFILMILLSNNLIKNNDGR